MALFRVLGFGLFLIIIALVMPLVFVELVKTLVVILQSTQKAFQAAGTLASYAGHIPPSAH